MLKRLEEEIKSWTLPLFIERTLFLLLAFFISTGMHEFFHFIVLTIAGVPAGMKIGLLTGATAYEPIQIQIINIIATLAGPVGSFLLGLIFWFSEGKEVMERGELSTLRFQGVIMFFLSSIFQLAPFISNTDGAKAIEFGLASWFVWLLWLAICGIIANIITGEKK